MVKTYNVGAHGIPLPLQSEVALLALASLPLSYTRHAMSEACNDRYGCLPASAFPKKFNVASGGELVEAESLNGKLSKFIVRRAVDAARSLVLVILVDGAAGLVKTLWTNLTSDNHSTLDVSKFSKP